MSIKRLGLLGLHISALELSRSVETVIREILIMILPEQRAQSDVHMTVFSQSTSRVTLPTVAPSVTPPMAIASCVLHFHRAQVRISRMPRLVRNTCLRDNVKAS